MLLLGAVASGAPVASSIHGQEMMFKNITTHLKSINLDSIERVKVNGSCQIAFSLSSVDSVEVGDRLIVWSEHPEVFSKESDGVWKALSPNQSVIHIDIEYIEADRQNLREAFPNHPLYSNGIALDVSQLVFVTAPADDVFCLYNPNRGEHLYTIDENEKEYLTGAGWKDEGADWLAPSESSSAIYRLYNSNAGDHHYTMDIQEKDRLVELGWNDEDIACYSAAWSAEPVYRACNPNVITGADHFMTSEEEYSALAALGWKPEEIAWLGMPSIPR